MNLLSSLLMILWYIHNHHNNTFVNKDKTTQTHVLPVSLTALVKFCPKLRDIKDNDFGISEMVSKLSNKS